MRNIYYSYRLCENIEKNMEVHKCEDDRKCPAWGVAGTMKYVNRKKANKTKNSISQEPMHEFVNWMRFETFAEKKGYIMNHSVGIWDIVRMKHSRKLH